MWLTSLMALQVRPRLSTRAFMPHAVQMPSLIGLPIQSLNRPSRILIACGCWSSFSAISSAVGRGSMLDGARAVDLDALGLALAFGP